MTKISRKNVEKKKKKEKGKSIKFKDFFFIKLN